MSNFIVTITNTGVFKSWKGDFKIKVEFHECGWASTWFVLVMGEDHVWHKVKVYNYYLNMNLFASFSNESEANDFALQIS